MDQPEPPERQPYYTGRIPAKPLYPKHPYLSSPLPSSSRPYPFPPPMPPAVREYLALTAQRDTEALILLEHLPTLHRAFTSRRQPIYIDCGCGWVFSSSLSWAIHTTAAIRGTK